MTGLVTGFPAVLLKVEGLVLAAVATWAYWKFGGPWWWFVAFILVPDLGMLGYLRGIALSASVSNIQTPSSTPT